MKKLDLENLLMIPGPTTVSNRVLKAMALPIIGHRTKGFSELLFDTTEKIKKVFQTENDTYLITGSGTAAMGMAISNTVNEGDKVLNIINGNFGDRFAKITATYGAKSIRLENEWGDAAKPEIVEKLLDENKDVKAVTIVHNETSTGVRNPIKEIGEIVKNYDALYVVDAVSSLGGDYVDVDKFGIDICITGSQKCIAAPPGMAAVTVSKKAWDIINKTEPKSFYLDIKPYKKSYDEKKQTPYTPSVSLIYAMNEALEMVLEEGLKNRVKRHENLAKATQEGLKAMGIELFANKNARSITVTSAKYPPGTDDKKFRSLLENKYKIVIAGGQANLSGKIFRVGHMGGVKPMYILATLGLIGIAFKELGIKIGSGIEVAANVLEQQGGKEYK